MFIVKGISFGAGTNDLSDVTPSKPDKRKRRTPAEDKTPVKTQRGQLDAGVWEIARSMCGSAEETLQMLEALQDDEKDDDVAVRAVKSPVPGPTSKIDRKLAALGNRKVKRVKATVVKKKAKDEVHVFCSHP